MPSEIRVDSLKSSSDTAIIVSYGASIPSSGIITGAGGINVTGIITASSFSGPGNQLTNLTMATESKAIAFKKIISFDEYRS